MGAFQGIRLERSEPFVRRWLAEMERMFGAQAAGRIAWKLAKRAVAPTVRNPPAFVTWAVQRPLGAWLPDGELDWALGRRTRRSWDDGEYVQGPSRISEITSGVLGSGHGPTSSAGAAWPL